MKNLKIFLLIALVAVLFTGCAQPVSVEQCVEGAKVYGFWNGLWHGMTAGFSFIGSLFDDKYIIYAINNNGGWYDFGFILGIGGLFGSGVTVRSER